MEYIEVDVTYYLDDLGYCWKIPHRMKTEYGQAPSDILKQYRYCWEREGRFNRFNELKDVYLGRGEFIQIKQVVPISEKWRYFYPYRQDS